MSSLCIWGWESEVGKEPNFLTRQYNVRALDLTLNINQEIPDLSLA
jgi:hypothetical protein